MIVSWPAGISTPGEMRRQYTHAIDIVPTLFECLGVELPAPVKGHTQHPIEGDQLRRRRSPTPRPRPARRRSSIRCSAPGRSGTRAGRRPRVSPAAPGAWADFAQQRWELFDTENDPSECHDLADRAPGEAAGAHRAVVGRGRRVPGAAARVPRCPRHPPDPPPAALEGPQPVRLLPGLRRGTGVGVAEHPQPLVHDRGRARGRRRPKRAACSSPRGRASVGTPLYLKDGDAQVRLQLRRRVRTDGRIERAATHRSRRRVGVLRQGGRRDADRGHADAAHPRPGRRIGADQDPTRQVLARR